MELLEIKEKVFCIATVMQECKYWHDTEQEENYLNEHEVDNIASFFRIHRPYITEIIEEVFCYMNNESKYGYDLSYIVNGDSNGWHIATEVYSTFINNPISAVSEPKYVGGYSSKYEFEPFSYIAPDALLDYLKNNVSHGLDIDEVSKVFAIGDYEYLRQPEELEEQCQ